MTLRAAECFFRAADRELVHFDVRDDGPAARGAIVFVHGLGEHLAKYDEWLRFARARNYHVAALDLRGHGATPGRRGDFAFEDLVSDLGRFVAVVGERWPAVPRFVVAHSLGALVALRWVAEAPHGAVRGLALSSPLIDIVETVPWWKRRLFQALVRVAPRTSLPRRSTVEKLTQDPERIAAWRADRLRHARITPRAAVGIVHAMEATRSAPLEISVPILLLIAPEDEVTSADAALRWAAETGAEVTVVEVAGARHEILYDVERAVAYARICDWCDAHLA